MRALALILALLLVASACGGDADDDDAGATDAGDEGRSGGNLDDEAVADALASTTTEPEGDAEDEAAADASDPTTFTSMDDWEALWAEERAAIVDRINAEGYGVDEDNVLIGPGGLEVDLKQCPSDWSETGGIDDTILIGHTTVLSGNAAAYGNIAHGMEVYFDYVNENGGINGTPIELIFKDDGYVATQTIELVGEMLQADKPFMVTTLGSPNTLATYDTLNDACIPQPFVQTGHPAWGDPEEHPWTSGLQMSYSTEAVFWGEWIKANLADQLPVKVAALIVDNDFGKAYGVTFERWVEQNPDVVSEFFQVAHDIAAPTVTNEMTTITAADPDVFIAMTGGNACLLAIQEAGNNGLTESAEELFMPSVCKDTNAFMIPAGDAAQDWLIVGGGLKTTTDPQYIDEPYIAFLNEELAEAGLDISVGLYGTGFGLYAWPHVQALLVASELEGGLTRSNYLLAMRSLDMTHPITLDGIRFSVNGGEDAYYIEGTDFARFDVASQSWVQEGGVVDLNGQSENCTWTDAGCT
jgi:branched-chain amino acid transport system substrate-binding protein